jgi:hypothetical protein
LVWAATFPKCSSLSRGPYITGPLVTTRTCLDRAGAFGAIRSIYQTERILNGAVSRPKSAGVPMIERSTLPLGLPGTWA